MSRSLRIGLLTYSTKARGGVVHTLSLAEVLQEVGHRVEIFALGKAERPGSFFRPVSVPYTVIPVDGAVDESTEEALGEKIARYIEAYHRALASRGVGDLDVCHAQDCISANALWRLRHDGVELRLLRTVHHVDDFSDPYLAECQEDSIRRPDACVVVSDFWRRQLETTFGRSSEVIHNGVDLARFEPTSRESRAQARQELGIGDQFVYLNVGGIEPRKNTLRLLRAFESAHASLVEVGRDAVLLLAGGETLLDYRSYRDEFDREFETSTLAATDAVRRLGPVDDRTIDCLYAAADVLAFPSTREGWGLVALEAMATGLPVLASEIPVFREYLADRENAVLVDPESVESIRAGLLELAADPELTARLAASGRSTAQRYSWQRTAERHLALYDECMNSCPPR